MKNLVDLLTRNFRIKSKFILYYIFYKIRYPQLKLRWRSTDFSVFISIFCEKEFQLPVKIKKSSLTIVDLGAYTGISVLYFNKEFPNAKIIAVEPEEENFKLLQHNTARIKNLVTINSGIWSKSTFLKIEDRNEGSWGFKVREVPKSENYDIKSVTLKEIMKKNELKTIDILKIDIEGSEKELFSKNSSYWIDRTNIIIIEIHDNIVSGCRKSVYSSLKLSEWNEFSSGEKIVFIRKNFI